MAEEVKPKTPDSQNPPVEPAPKTYSEAEYNALSAQLLEAQKSLSDANTTIQSYKDMDIDGIKKSAEDWQKKYEQAEEARKAKEYTDGVSAFVEKQGLSNDIYKQHLISQITAKKLQFDDKGVLLGGEDVVKQLRESCPEAFAVQQNNPFMGSTRGAGSMGGSSAEESFTSRLRSAMGLNNNKK